MERNRPTITDIYGQLSGRVSMGLINRVGSLGGVPESGPGRYSVRRALQPRVSSNSMQSKSDRRSWNLNNQQSPRRR